MTATLYGSAISLYTGRARSYLIKAGIPYREVAPVDAHYNSVVLPQAGNRRGVPTLELDDGTVIRDGAAIIDHFEAASGHPFAPTTPRHRVLSLLFDVIGAEGLLRPAMHYRWNYPEDNLAFVLRHFATMVPSGPEQQAKTEKLAERMRAGAQAFGAVPDTFALVERLYLDVLDALEQHFAAYPYLLGGRPCIGDFGMLAPLYAHLGRDPAPLRLMQTRAPNVFRWVERMNRAEPDTGEYPEQDDAWLPDDAVPDTLVAVLRALAVDFVPETRAAAERINAWLADEPDLAAGTEAARGVGMAQFTVSGADGVTIDALAQPYRFFLLARVQDAVAALDDAADAAVRAVLGEAAMAEVLDLRLTCGITRAGNLEVWA